MTFEEAYSQIPEGWYLRKLAEMPEYWDATIIKSSKIGSGRGKTAEEAIMNAIHEVWIKYDDR